MCPGEGSLRRRGGGVHGCLAHGVVWKHSRGKLRLGLLETGAGLPVERVDLGEGDKRAQWRSDRSSKDIMQTRGLESLLRAIKADREMRQADWMLLYFAWVEAIVR